MKVLYVVTDDWYFRTHRLHLARAALRAGYEVELVSSLSRDASDLEREGLRVHDVRFARTVLGQVHNARLTRRLAGIYRRARPDVVHHVGFLPSFYGAGAVRAADVERVIDAVPGLGHAFAEPGLESALLRVALERGWRRALADERTLALFQNPEDEGHFVARGWVPRARSRRIDGAGVDVERFRPTPEPAGTPVVLCAARMLWSKGIGVLVEASLDLRARGLVHELLLAGRIQPSNPAAIPERVLREWTAAGQARWLGPREDVPQLMQRAQVVALPSWYREGIPLSLIEGAAAARALVATDVPGCREIVQDGVTGLLVGPRDARALADALGVLLAEPALRARLARAGRELAVGRFSTDVVDRAVLDLYAPGAGRAGRLERIGQGC
jgi:glycosyltransferase involved in cell wall biosynthesis